MSDSKKLSGRPKKMPHEQIKEYWRRRRNDEPWVTKAQVARELKISRRHLYGVIYGEYTSKAAKVSAGIPLKQELIIEWT